MRVSRYWFVTLALALLLVLSACAVPAVPQQPAQPKPPTATPAPEKPAAAPAAVSSLYEAAKKEGQIVFWTHSLQNGEGLVAAFKQKYPGIDLKVWDARTPDLVNKALEESKAGRLTADVLTTDELSMNDLKDLLLAYDWPTTKAWEKEFNPTHNLWRYYARSPKIPVYNTELVAAADVPKGLDDLKNAKWRGKAINSSSNDQLPLIYAWLWGEGGKLDWDKSFAFHTEMVNNTRPMFDRGFEGAIGRLSAGEFQIHQMSSLNTYFRYKWKGAPLALVPIDPVPTTTWAVGVTAKAPHPNAAKLFADFFTSPEAQVIFSDGQGVLINSPDAMKKARPHLELNKLGLKVVAAPSSVYTPENSKKAQDFWNKLLGVRGS